MTQKERVNQYNELNAILKDKIVNVSIRHNLINNIIDNKDYDRVIAFNK